MKIAIIGVFCLLLSLGLHAQIGLGLAYSTFDQAVFGSHFDLKKSEKTSSVLVSLDYWFRLKQKRLEFLPTIYAVSYGGDFETKTLGFQFATTVYPFDFAGDCNCPTFSKENDLIKKGFFIRVIPGIGHWTADASSIRGYEGSDNLDVWLPEIAFAAGLDIGISNLLTISPEIGLRHIFNGTWGGMVNFDFDGFDLFEPGIRFGFRFDEKNYGFKSRRRR